MERTASPDGVTQGQMTWFDYWGKSSSIGTNGGQAVTNWFTRGTNALPRLVALVLPDGATRFTYNEYNAAGNSTDVVSTWSQGQVVLLRTNRFVYDTNLVNLLTTTNAAGVRSASNLWSINQVIASYDALGERSVRWLLGNYPFYVAGNTAP